MNPCTQCEDAMMKAIALPMFSDGYMNGSCGYSADGRPHHEHIVYPNKPMSMQYSSQAAGLIISCGDTAKEPPTMALRQENYIRIQRIMYTYQRNDAR